ARSAPATPPGTPDGHAAPAAPPGEAGLAPAERRPADRAEPDRDRNATPAAAVPADQRRRVNRRGDDRTRRPAPVIVGIDPATVVERRPPPRRVVHPGPA